MILQENGCKIKWAQWLTKGKETSRENPGTLSSLDSIQVAHKQAEKKLVSVSNV